MTNYEKSQIVRLQQQGYGYKRIAGELGLAVNGVKTFCRRNPIKAVIDKPSKPCTCQQCGIALVQVSGRKTKRFCSDHCRNTWWNEHPDRVNRKAFYDMTCCFCGQIFQSYGNKNRKYCSRTCYANARRKSGIKDE